MSTALLGVFALMAIAWALHDRQVALQRQKREQRNHITKVSIFTLCTLHPGEATALGYTPFAPHDYSDTQRFCLHFLR